MLSYYRRLTLISRLTRALLPCDASSPRAVHRRVVQEIGAYAHTISAYPVIAAVGGIAPIIEDLPDSRSEALQTLDYLLHQHSAPVNPRESPVHAEALFEDYRIPLSLLKIGQFIDDNGLADRDEISRIEAYDADHRADFLNTLRAYLATNGNISATATRLHIHNNTARYRVGRLVEHFKLDLEDPQLRLWLGLRLTTVDLALQTPSRREA